MIQMLIDSYQTVVNWIFDDSVSRTKEKLQNHQVTHSWLFLPAVHWLYYSAWTKGTYWALAITLPLAISGIFWTPMVAILTLPTFITFLTFLGYEAKLIDNAVNAIDLSNTLTPLTEECTRIQAEHEHLNQRSNDIEMQNFTHGLNDPRNWHLNKDQTSLEQHINKVPEQATLIETIDIIKNSSDEISMIHMQKLDDTIEKLNHCSDLMIQTRLEMSHTPPASPPPPEAKDTIDTTNNEMSNAIELNTHLCTELAKAVASLTAENLKLHQMAYERSQPKNDLEIDSVDSSELEISEEEMEELMAMNERNRQRSQALMREYEYRSSQTAVSRYG